MTSCPEHPMDCVIMVCVTCDKGQFVCKQCIEDKHRGHSFSTIKKFGITAKTRLEKMALENSKTILEVKDKIDKCDNMLRKQLENEMKITNEIQERTQKIREAVNDRADDITRNFVNKTTSSREILGQHKAKLKTYLEQSKSLQTIIEDKIASGSNFELIKAAHEIQLLNLNEISTPTVESYVFTADDLTESHLQKIVGEVLSTRTSSSDRQAQHALGPSFCHPLKSYVSSLEPAVPNHCWIVCKYSKNLQLFDDKGVKKQTIQCLSGIYGVTTTESGTLFVCEEKRIIKISYGQTPCPVFDTGDLYTNGICSLFRGEVAVILVDEFSYNVTSNSRRILVKCTTRGGTSKEAIRDNFGDELFVYPFRICSNRSKDTIVVVNRTSSELSHLVFFDNHLQLIQRYMGEGIVVLSDMKYNRSEIYPKVFISDAVFAQNDDLVLAEVHTKSVQILSKKNNIARIIRYCASVPRSVAVHGDNSIWVASSNGQISIIKGEKPLTSH